MRVVQLTPQITRNPYYTSVVPHLVESGVDVTLSVDRSEILSIVRDANYRDNILLHLHQLDPLYRDNDGLATSTSIQGFIDWIVRLRMLGARLIYTLHNRRPHDGRYLEFDHEAHAMIASLASRFVVHGQGAIEAAEAWIESEKVSVVPHPNLCDAYGPILDKSASRRELKLSEDEFVILALGEIKPYKGVDIILDAFDRANLDGSRLVIVGKGGDEEYVRSLEDRVACLGFSRVRLVVRLLTESEVSRWLATADAAVFGFEEILMSGSLMLALSYGLPVIAPRIGCLPEYVIDGVNGYLYEAGDPNALARAMHRATHGLPGAEAVRGSVEQFSPRAVADQMRALYLEASRD